MSAHFGFVTVVPPFVGAQQEESVVAEYAAALVAHGGERVLPRDLGGPAPLFYLVATGGTERVVLDLRAKRAQSAPSESVVLIAHPGNNSLPAALEVLARLQQDGEHGRILYLCGPKDDEGFARITQAAEDLSVQRALRASRIGLIGDPSDWLVASSPAPDVVRDTWGPDVISIPMEELTTRLAAIGEGDVAEAVASLTGNATGVVEPSTAELTDVARVHAALRALVDAYELDALTVRCFDLVLNLETTGCFGLAELTDEGFIAGCEGDLVSTVGLLWVYALLGKIPWMANPARLDESENTLWLAHCTVPRTMVESYRLRSHFESGLGVGIQGELPLGPVTLLRIGGTRMKRLWLAEGEIERTGDAENLCRTQAEVRLSSGHVSELLHAPLGNHLVLVPGHHADRLRAWWEMFV
ncbi:MAG: fucose isomerase [Coriobacteriia bacterium]|nr:fucose isomerase [Coriobacteriia bacterium]